MRPPAHITVCVCTYRRPELLRRLLVHLFAQETGALFTLSIVVIDNDQHRSAADIVTELRSNAPVELVYGDEPVRNIALARNRSVEKAEGDLVAFIDDDEWAGPTWLLTLFKVLANQPSIAGVMGPVMPCFPEEAPAWLAKTRLHEKSGLASGTLLHWKQTRTSNVLMRRAVLDPPADRFDVRFDKGGEDVDLFKRLIARGHRFLWCSEAPVFESIPPERCTRTYLLKRALLRGQGTAKYHALSSLEVLKSTAALPMYVLAVPLASLAGHHQLIKVLSKTAEHSGLLLALLGIELVKEY